MTNEEHRERMILRGSLAFIAGLADVRQNKFIGDDPAILHTLLRQSAAIAAGALVGENVEESLREGELLA